MYGTLRPDQHLQEDQVLADLIGSVSTVWEEPQRELVLTPTSRREDPRPYGYTMRWYSQRARVLSPGIT